MSGGSRRARKRWSRRWSRLRVGSGAVQLTLPLGGAIGGGARSLTDLEAMLDSFGQDILFGELHEALASWLPAAVQDHELSRRKTFWSFLQWLRNAIVHRGREASNVRPSDLVTFAGHLGVDASDPFNGLSESDINEIWWQALESLRNEEACRSAEDILLTLYNNLVSHAARRIGPRLARCTPLTTSNTRERLLARSFWTGDPPPAVSDPKRNGKHIVWDTDYRGRSHDSYDGRANGGCLLERTRRRCA